MYVLGWGVVLLPGPAAIGNLPARVYLERMQQCSNAAGSVIQAAWCFDRPLAALSTPRSRSSEMASRLTPHQVLFLVSSRRRKAAPEAEAAPTTPHTAQGRAPGPPGPSSDSISD